MSIVDEVLEFKRPPPSPGSIIDDVLARNAQPAAPKAPVKAEPFKGATPQQTAVAAATPEGSIFRNPFVGIDVFTGQATPEQVAQSQFKDVEGKTLKVGQGLVRFKNGTVQTTMDVAETLGYMDKGMADAFTQKTKAEKEMVDKAFKKEFGDDFGFAVAELSGEIIPYFALPAAGTTWLARTMYGMFAGGGAGFSTYKEGDTLADRNIQREQETMLGTAMGAGAATAVEGFLGTKHFITDTIAGAIESTKEWAVRGVEVSRRTGIRLKLSQIVNDPKVEQLENFARVGAKGEKAARALETGQVKDTIKYFTRAAQKAGPKGNFAETVKTTFDDVLGSSSKRTGLLGKRAADAERDFTVSGEPVPVVNTINKINMLIDEFAQPGLGPEAKAIVSRLTVQRDELLEAGGELTPRALQKNLEVWGRASKGTGKVFTDAVDRASAMRPASIIAKQLNDDLDDMIAAGGKGSKELRIARDNYAQNTAAIREVEDSALGALFGKKKNPSQAQIEDRFLKMTGEEITSVMGILEKTSPTTRQGLQRFWLESAIKNAKTPGSADAYQFVPAKLLKISEDQEQFRAVFNDMAMRQHVSIGLEAVRRVMVNNLTTGGKSVNRMKDFMVAASQRTGGAIAQQVIADIFAPRLVAKYIMDPRGVRALQELSKPQVAPQTGAAAAAILLHLAGG